MHRPAWISRLWAMWLSVRSWMHWRQRRKARREKQRQEMLFQVEVLARALLLEAMTPLAAALKRMDQRQMDGMHQLYKHLQQQEEMLLEVLQNQQPAASQQIFPLIGQPKPAPTSRS